MWDSEPINFSIQVLLAVIFKKRNRKSAQLVVAASRGRRKKKMESSATYRRFLWIELAIYIDILVGNEPYNSKVFLESDFWDH